MLKGKLIMVDLDGVLCKGECWTPYECMRAKPISKNIDKVNRLSQGNCIIVWTARSDELMSETFKWLKENGVIFDAVSNKKPGASYYIDDKSVEFDDILKEV